MCSHIWEVKTNYVTGIATEICRCGETKQVPGTFSSVMSSIKDKTICFRSRGKGEVSDPLMVRQTLWKTKGRLEK